MAGIISATISMNTVRESRTVMPGCRDKDIKAQKDTKESQIEGRKKKKKQHIREGGTGVSYRIIGMPCLFLPQSSVFLTLLKKHN